MKLLGHLEFEKILIKEHAAFRMLTRNISKSELYQVLEFGEEIEDYPNNYPFPSKLVLGIVNKKPIHIVVAMDYSDETIIIVTVYEPDNEHFEADFQNKKNKMNCVACKVGNLKPGTAMIPFERESTTILVKDVKAMICDQCGTWYIDPDTLEEVRQIIENEAKTGHELSVVRMKKAA